MGVCFLFLDKLNLSQYFQHSRLIVIGFLKGKSAIRIFRDYMQVKRNFIGRHFWARGYCVSTVGLDEEVIREYIRNQEKEEKRQE